MYFDTLIVSSTYTQHTLVYRNQPEPPSQPLTRPPVQMTLCRTLCQPCADTTDLFREIQPAALQPKSPGSENSQML